MVFWLPKQIQATIIYVLHWPYVHILFMQTHQNLENTLVQTDLSCVASLFRWCVTAHRLQLLLSVSDPGLSVFALSLKVVWKTPELCLSGSLQDCYPLLLCVLYQLLNLWFPAVLQMLAQTFTSSLQVEHLWLTLRFGGQNSLKVKTQKWWCGSLEVRSCPRFHSKCSLSPFNTTG